MSVYLRHSTIAAKSQQMFENPTFNRYVMKLF